MDEGSAVALLLAGVLRVEMDAVGVVGQGTELEEETLVWNESEACIFFIWDYSSNS